MVFLSKEGVCGETVKQREQTGEGRFDRVSFSVPVPVNSI